MNYFQPSSVRLHLFSWARAQKTYDKNSWYIIESLLLPCKGTDMPTNNTDVTPTLLTIAHQTMVERNMLPEFEGAVQKELATINQPAACPSNSPTKDLRHLAWVSIDNDDSLDLDQLTYAEKLPKNTYKIYVAVADVDALVKKKSAIDQHAAHNTTSVYTPGKVFPMLPDKLSTNLTSLNPQQERQAIIIEMVISSEGSVTQYDIYSACVRNQAKLAYDSIADWLDQKGTIPAELAKLPHGDSQIILQDHIAGLIKNYRHKQGALTFKTIEMQPVLKEGKIIALQEVVDNRAHQIIENFMISANTSATKFLESHKIPTLRRVVRTPKNWNGIIALAETYHTHLPNKPDSKALEVFLRERQVASPVTFPDLSLAIIKLLGRGEYVAATPGATPIGHFDLALQDYAHTTAPNRRFPDLIMQRLLKGVLFKANSSAYSIAELSQLATYCTEKEDDATKIERKMKKVAAAILLSSQIGSQFEGIITGINENGTWVRLFHPPVEGKLIRGFTGLLVGTKVLVELTFVDINNGFIDFKLIKKINLSI